VFENRRDVRCFLALLAGQVREGLIEVLAYAILTTHYHLILGSPVGALSDVMMHVLNEYVRRFNRGRRRDGSLFRGRFGSRPVLSERYFRTLVRYVDQNAPQARLVTSTEDYPYGSAAQYVSSRRAPWLRTDAIDAWMGDPLPADRRQRYLETVGRPISDAERRLVTARLTRAPSSEDDLDDLVGAAPPAVRAWMERKARLADNTFPGQSYADGRLVLTGVKSAEARLTDLRPLSPAGRRRNAWPVLKVGLLRDIAGFTLAEIAVTGVVSATGASRRLAEHRRLMVEDSVYACLAAEIARLVLDLQWGGTSATGGAEVSR
jgi:hypothetical protein